jgi:hypothetical protein
MIIDGADKEKKMKKGMMSIIAGVMSFIILGCGVTPQVIRQKAQNERTDVFTEISYADAPAKGFAALIVRAAIKTHPEGYYWLESKDAPCGRPGYPFVINIDGQAAIWKVDGKKDRVPLYDKDGRTVLDPEAGEGVKYILEKRIQLTPGKHKVFIGLPVEGYFKEAEVSLKEGDCVLLEFKPVYNYKTRPTRIPAFKEGIKKYDIHRINTCAE